MAITLLQAWHNRDIRYPPLPHHPPFQARPAAPIPVDHLDHHLLDPPRPDAPPLRHHRQDWTHQR